ncbi:sensor histidine kinase [Ktedonobacter racemifer]|uniref:histidine kinase n=1 Tax=Ktedonobacter racemifer DSM 44963 TaxID=485913 RepID=D6U3C5_KTERA|nr:sensor histidine kinase [Ktedonobacter racemifer]EFH81129.1 integral membrane sensor signal transduction histidine kinase [Ktedonobacter racemifer DSM 44963]
MEFKQGQRKLQARRVPTWFLHFSLSLLACVGYLFSLFETAHTTLASFLLLTVTYGAWLVIFHLGKLSDGNPRRSWLLVLFCLACVSPLLSLLGPRSDWLWLLPVLTTTLMAALRPRVLGLSAAFVLWLSSSLVSTLIEQHGDVSSQVTLLLTFIFAFGFASTIRELALAHVRMQQLIRELEGSNTELEAAHTQLLEYITQVEDLSAVRERNRIAREIHDTLGHSLTLLAVQLETATQLEVRGDAGLHEELVEARRVAKACLTDVRHSVEALRPDAATAGPFEEVLRQLVAEFDMTCREIEVTLDLEEVTHALSQELRMALYRCSQEALTNIRKHARATKVLLRLSTSDEQVELTVLDNGQGSTSQDDNDAPGFGLLGMRERVALLDGTLKAGPEPGHGWRVEAVIPLEKRGSAEVAAKRSGETRDGA